MTVVWLETVEQAVAAALEVSAQDAGAEPRRQAASGA